MVLLYGISDETTDVKYAGALLKNTNLFNTAVEIYNDPDLKSRNGWKLKAESKGLKCFSKRYDLGKVFTVTIELPINLQACFEDHWHQIEKMPEWNNTVHSCEKLVTLTDHADVIHYATSDVLVVKGRDLVVIRQWRKVGDAIYVVASSFDNEIPVIPKKKRAWGNLISGKFMQHPTDANKTVVEYLCSVDFKDNLLPDAVINSGIADIALKDAHAAFKRCEDLSKK